MMERPITTLADGLGHPEGPDLLADGSVVFVETYLSRVGRWSESGGVETYAACGGGPNACLLGDDGALYITQNGGTVGAWKAPVMRQPSIQRAWPDGRVETVATAVEGISFLGPNDLSWGPDGSLYFTDPGDYYPHAPSIGRLFCLHPDGAGELVEEIGPSYPNGIIAEADGSLLWVESYGRGVYRKRAGGKSEKLFQLAEGHVPDGMKLDQGGNIWITTFSSGGVDIISSGGDFIDFLHTGGVPTNCIFAGDCLLITDFGDSPEVTDQAPLTGRLWRVEVGVQGMPVARGHIVSEKP